MKQATFYQRMPIITTQHLRRKLPQLTNNVQKKTIIPAEYHQGYCQMPHPSSTLHCLEETDEEENVDEYKL
jgi:hypothetical protein